MPVCWTHLELSYKKLSPLITLSNITIYFFETPGLLQDISGTASSSRLISVLEVYNASYPLYFVLLHFEMLRCLFHLQCAPLLVKSLWLLWMFPYTTEIPLTKSLCVCHWEILAQTSLCHCTRTKSSCTWSILLGFLWRYRATDVAICKKDYIHLLKHDEDNKFVRYWKRCLWRK
jgi:hypothetical protein